MLTSFTSLLLCLHVCVWNQVQEQCQYELVTPLAIMFSSTLLQVQAAYMQMLLKHFSLSSPLSCIQSVPRVYELSSSKSSRRFSTRAVVTYVQLQHPWKKITRKCNREGFEKKSFRDAEIRPTENLWFGLFFRFVHVFLRTPETSVCRAPLFPELEFVIYSIIYNKPQKKSWQLCPKKEE